MFENGVEEEVISGLHMRSVVFYTFHNTLLDDKLKKDEVYGACEKCGRDEKCI